MNLHSLKGLLLGAGAATLLSISLPLPAQTTAASPSQAPSSMPVYQPPLRGTTAGGRIGGGTRGTGEQTVTMSVLAPEHPGLTVTPQPRLYWYLSDSIDIPAEITVVDRRSTDPLLEMSVTAPIRAGIHVLDLGQQGIRLEPGVRYEWFVALIVDENQRSNDIVAGGEIELVAPAADLASRVSAAGEAGAAVYAGAGVWYDAVDAVSMRVARRPADAVAREQRAARSARAHSHGGPRLLGCSPSARR